MKNNTLITFIILLVTSIGFSQISSGFEKHADSILKVWDNQDKPGIAAGIIKDGEIIYLKGFGSANIETGNPITPQTKFQLGELSKQFTTLSILILEEQGAITLDEDIRKYIPKLPEFANKVTIANLLNHSSGLHDIRQVGNMINGNKSIVTQSKALELIASQKKLSFVPGTDFSFHESVTESVLMAEIVARSSGISFADFVKINIFDPLGMKNSLIRDDHEAILRNVAEPYQKEGEGYKKREVLSSIVGGINAYSSAEDLAKWYLNFSNPNGTLGRLIQRLDTPVELTNGKKFVYFWGEMVIGRDFKHPERGLPKFWNFGIQGGYGSNIFRFTEQNITSFVLGNNNQYNGALAMGVLETFLKDLYMLPPAIDFKTLKTKKLTINKLKALKGHYWDKNAGYAMKVFVENDTLRSKWLLSERSVTLVPLSDDTFQRVVANEDVVLFKFNKEGANTAISFLYNDSKPDILVKYEPVKLSAQSLQSYAGTYYNREYASLFTFYIENGQLIARNLDHNDIKFLPVSKDVFTSKSTFFPGLRFLRDKSNVIKGFEVDANGIHNLVFEKTPSQMNKSN